MSETETEIVINTAPALAQRVSTPALDQVARLARLEALTRAMGHELDAMRQRLANMETVASADHATVGTVRELLDLLTTDEDAWNVLVQICRAGSMRNDSGALLNFVRRTTGRPVVKPAALA